MKYRFFINLCLYGIIGVSLLSLTSCAQKKPPAIRAVIQAEKELPVIRTDNTGGSTNITNICEETIYLAAHSFSPFSRQLPQNEWFFPTLLSRDEKYNSVYYSRKLGDTSQNFTCNPGTAFCFGTSLSVFFELRYPVNDQNNHQSFCRVCPYNGTIKLEFCS